MRLAVVLLSLATLVALYGGAALSSHALWFGLEGAPWLACVAVLAVTALAALSALFGAFAIWMDPVAARAGLSICLGLCLAGAAIGPALPWAGVPAHGASIPSWMLALFCGGAGAVPCALARALSWRVGPRSSLGR